MFEINRRIDLELGDNHAKSKKTIKGKTLYNTQKIV